MKSISIDSIDWFADFVHRLSDEDREALVDRVNAANDVLCWEQSSVRVDAAASAAFLHGERAAVTIDDDESSILIDDYTARSRLRAEEGSMKLGIDEWGIDDLLSKNHGTDLSVGRRLSIASLMNEVAESGIANGSLIVFEIDGKRAGIITTGKRRGVVLSLLDGE